MVLYFLRRGDLLLFSANHFIPCKRLYNPFHVWTCCVNVSLFLFVRISERRCVKAVTALVDYIHTGIVLSSACALCISYFECCFYQREFPM